MVAEILVNDEDGEIVKVDADEVTDDDDEVSD